MNILSVTILIERNDRKFGCLIRRRRRVSNLQWSEIGIVEKMFLSNEEPSIIRDLRVKPSNGKMAPEFLNS